ncbi:uncharacterized protein C1orf127 homolog [Nannospalax galili]|uniref:uncharacterized protein C1orf127 homolog n=1 Tax=Nannospalax galili TaxID=1026970 RepID=UPI00111BDF9D|nr:uncharacterized protein C1orf127 homolog [Nannospalax galili]
MWGSTAVVWAICLACIQPAVFPWILPFRSDKDRPRPAQTALSEKVECFSDYMTLQIPRSRVQGLRQWLSRILHLPGAQKAPDHLDALLARCGYLLHPAREGHFIFRALYSACFVKKEKANYRLEIRIFQKGAQRWKQTESYIMKCPAITSRLGQQSVRCDPEFIQVSRPLPPTIEGGQTLWLLSLRGELVASLEDASLMGLDVDIGATTVTIQSSRQDLLQRQEMENTCLELLPLWLVSGIYAYSFEAVCPPVSSWPGSEVFVYIPKQGRGLVKRGSFTEETLSPRSLQVHQSDTFTVTEDRDFVIISIPSAMLLKFQPCQEGEAPGMQAFYRVDVSLSFVETISPVHWTVENFFQCVGSREELPVSTATPKTTSSPLSPGQETPPVEVPYATSSQVQDTQLAALEEPSRDFVHLLPEKSFKPEPAPFLKTTGPAGGSQESTAWLFLRAIKDQRGSQVSPEKAGIPLPLQTSATLPLEPMGATQADHTPSHPVFLASTSLTTYLSSEISSPGWPSWRPDGSKMLLESGPSLTLTESPGAMRAEQDSTQSSKSPFLLTALSRETVASVEPIPGESTHISEEFQLSMRPSISSLAEEGVVSHPAPRMSQEISHIVKAEGPPQSDCDPSRKGAKGYLDLPFSEPSQVMKGLELSTQLGTDTTFITPRGRQPEASAHLNISGREPPEMHRVGPAAPLTAFPKSPLPFASKNLAAPCEEELDRTPHPELAPTWPEGWHEWEASHTTRPLPSYTPRFPAPAETTLPSLGEPGTLFPDDQGVLPQQEPSESILPGPEVQLWPGMVAWAGTTLSASLRGWCLTRQADLRGWKWDLKRSQEEEAGGNAARNAN